MLPGFRSSYSMDLYCVDAAKLAGTSVTTMQRGYWLVDLLWGLTEVPLHGEDLHVLPISRAMDRRVCAYLPTYLHT